MRHISLEVIPTGEEGCERHNSHAYVGENVVLVEEGDEGLNKDDYRACHLRHSLDLAEH